MAIVNGKYYVAVNGTSGNNTLNGTANNDYINALAGNDVIYAGAGADIVYAGLGDDKAYGQAGDDVMMGGTGNDYLDGGVGNDTMCGDAGNDVMVGGEGNDLLQAAGGYYAPGGNDTFVFNFEKVTVSQANNYTSWLVKNGHADMVNGNELRDGVTQNDFSTTYTSWVKSLGLGKDMNGDGQVSVEMKQNTSGVPTIEGATAADMAKFTAVDTVQLATGKVTHERVYANSFGENKTVVTSKDGHDTITFMDDGDKLQMCGITQKEFDSLFSVTTKDVNGDGKLDTQVALYDMSWSVDLIGVQLTQTHSELMFG